MAKKYQSTIEFIMIFTLVLAALIVILFITTERVEDINQEILEVEVRMVLNSIVTKLNTVVLEGNGFSSNLTLPQQIVNMDYSVQIQSNYVTITLLNITYIDNILTENVIGSLQKGVNVIRNVNNNVVIG